MVALNSEPIKAVAAVVKWDKRRVTLDGSSQLANAIFLRLEREFGTGITYDQIATQLRADEETLFEMLGIEEDRQ